MLIQVVMPRWSNRVASVRRRDILGRGGTSGLGVRCYPNDALLWGRTLKFHLGGMYIVGSAIANGGYVLRPRVLPRVWVCPSGLSLVLGSGGMSLINVLSNILGITTDSIRLGAS
jgi:hypothetical protein